nr:AlNc14C27G2650 [Albugo laibachii Nc14]|eukprot:CCA16914.1 AlNc14C27G2650 [Albugo laibachii Nc14]
MDIMRVIQSPLVMKLSAAVIGLLVLKKTPDRIPGQALDHVRVTRYHLHISMRSFARTVSIPNTSDRIFAIRFRHGADKQELLEQTQPVIKGTRKATKHKQFKHVARIPL